MKNNRQKQILAIIGDHDVETQEDLIAQLKASGFKATQATVSRDIKELKLIKIATDNGHYKYVSTMIEEGKPNAKYHTILRETVTSVKRAGSLVVVRTYD
ncbi:MAG: arginine repressor, partial [Clostridia bacterium]|nr:arginine repressor [Clostridia bacterium]